MLERLSDEGSPQGAGAEAPAARRINADSFRALQARLAGRKLAPIPDIAIVRSEPEPPVFIPPTAPETVDIPWQAPQLAEPVFADEPEAPVEPIIAEAVVEAAPAPVEAYVEPIVVEAAVEAAPEPAEAPALVEAYAEPIIAEAVVEAAHEPVEAPAPVEVHAEPVIAEAMVESEPEPVAEPAAAEVQAEATVEPVAVEEPIPEPEPEEPVGVSEPEPPDREPVAAAPEPVAAEPTLEPKPAVAADAAPATSSIKDLIGSLEAKFGAGVTLLRKPAPAATDPFDSIKASLQARDEAVAPVAAQPYEIEESDAFAGDTARSLLDIMSGGGASQPQERALASDSLLRLIPRIPAKGLVALADRLAIMEHPPALIAARLIRDPRPEVAAPLLERCSALTDKDLLAVVAESGPAKQRLVARRRVISPALCEALIAHGDESVLLTLARNAGAAISHEGFQRLSRRAKTLPSIQAQLVTRIDTPAPIAFELFWMLQPVLRRLVISRFLTDSETLNRILKLTMAANAGDDADAVPLVPDPERLEALAGQLLNGNSQLAAAILSEIAGIDEGNALRIVGDTHGEPLAVILRVLGLTRGQFGEFIVRLKESPASPLVRDRDPEELQSIFDQLSPNKARVLLTYWDWASKNTGPYAAAA